MKEKHLRARIDQCLRNAELSRCPRRKFGAMLIDPRTNSILADGYNGPPRGEDGLCGGLFCARDGLRPEDVVIRKNHQLVANPDPMDSWSLSVKGQHVGFFRADEAAVARKRLLDENPPIQSGTHMEIGCHHAEANVLANAMRRGIATEGAWLIVTGEPCTMCAKYLHHGGIAKVFVVRGGYVGGDAGVQYLTKYGVEVEYVEGPQDPRTVS